MSKRLILHIGAEKTATTYIQNYFSVNREAYRNTGVLYPKTSFGDHAQFSLIAALHEIDHGFGLEFAPKGKKYTIETEWDPLIKRLNNQSKFHTVLLSVEHFSSRLKINGLEKLKEILAQLEGYEIQIIHYFRRQDAFFQSWYSTHIKAGGSKKLNQALSDDIKNPWFFDVKFLINKWKKTFPDARFIVRPYDYVVKHSDILQDFISHLELPDIDNSELPKLDKNESWDPMMIAVSRYINERYANILGEKRYQLLESISGQMKGMSSSKNILSESKRNYILDAFKQSNIDLCAEYNMDYDEIFKNSLGDDFTDPDELSVTDSMVAEYALKALKDKV